MSEIYARVYNADDCSLPAQPEPLSVNTGDTGVCEIAEQLECKRFGQLQKFHFGKGVKLRYLLDLDGQDCKCIVEYLDSCAKPLCNSANIAVIFDNEFRSTLQHQSGVKSQQPLKCGNVCLRHNGTLSPIKLV
jgi:hypothetical protein